MSNHFVSINRGKDGTSPNQFTTGTASTAGDDIELRIADADGQDRVMTRLDIEIALKAFERFFAESSTTFPPPL